jgi:hypothetical protein
MAERNQWAFAINGLRGGEDLQLQELPPAHLLKGGGGGLLLHLARRVVEREEDSKRRALALHRALEVTDMGGIGPAALKANYSHKLFRNTRGVAPRHCPVIYGPPSESQHGSPVEPAP